MSSALARLYKAHPLIFEGKEPHWSDLPPGWYPLVDALCLKLQQQMTAEELAAFRVSQLKEKYGTLRFYFEGPANPAVDALVDETEEASGDICMECGQPGRRREGGWIVTLCNACAAKR